MSSIKKAKSISKGKTLPASSYERKLASMEAMVKEAQKKYELAKQDALLSNIQDEEMDAPVESVSDSSDSESDSQSVASASKENKRDPDKCLFKSWISKSWVTFCQTQSASNKLSGEALDEKKLKPLDHFSTTLFQWATMKIRESLAKRYNFIFSKNKSKRYMPEHISTVRAMMSYETEPTYRGIFIKHLVKTSNIKTWIISEPALLQSDINPVKEDETKEGATISKKAQVSSGFITSFIDHFLDELFTLYEAILLTNFNFEDNDLRSPDLLDTVIRWLVARQHMKMPKGSVLME